MKKLPFLFFILNFFISLQVYAQSFEYNERCRTAYQTLFKLKINEGNQLLFKEKQQNKENLMPYFLENYADFLTLYISDDATLYKRLLPKREQRLDILAKGDPKSPFYLYTQANLHLQWAFIKVKFGDYFSSIWDVKKAYSLLKTNQKKFPDFEPNLKDLALLNTLFGAIPDKYKFGAKLLGLKGDIEQGLKEFSSLFKDPNMLFREEATIMYTMLLLHLGKDNEGAWNTLTHMNLSLGDNLLNYYIRATVAHYTGKNDEVIRILSARPGSDDYYPFPFLDYMIGNAKLNRLDTDADNYLKDFLKDYKGKDYIKETYRKLAWYWLINHRKDLYLAYIKLVATKGSTSTDEDKAAEKEALTKDVPQINLLKARLLSDGGYYYNALKQLASTSIKNLNTQDKLEYYYRKARILDDMGKPTEAVPLYIWTIEHANNSSSYFAPNACIKLGYYFEKMHNNNKATFYYKQALTYSNYEYKNSIDAQAKAGLNRLK